eukprot:1157646-Pelagomonas_calceolata.AAC.17
MLRDPGGVGVLVWHGAVQGGSARIACAVDLASMAAANYPAAKRGDRLRWLTVLKQTIHALMHSIEQY